MRVRWPVGGSFATVHTRPDGSLVAADVATSEIFERKGGDGNVPDALAPVGTGCVLIGSGTRLAGRIAWIEPKFNKDGKTFEERIWTVRAKGGAKLVVLNQWTGDVIRLEPKG